MIEEISNTGVVEGYSNGKRTQEIIFKSEKHLYKITICSESYEKQSYAKLYKKDETGWTVIKAVNPKRDFGIDISYKKNYSQDVFEPIISDFYNLVEKIDKIPTL